ncbi:MAG: Ig-like domain-containing protein, partial [Thermoplasmata archaeon]
GIQYELYPAAPTLTSGLNVYFNTSRPGLYISAPIQSDPDSDSGYYLIELSRDNWNTIWRTYNQTLSTSGWGITPVPYSSNASFVFPEDLPEGEYQVRIRQYDGYFWGNASAAYTFWVDITSPIVSINAPVYSNNTLFTILWSASDNIALSSSPYTLEVNINNGGWQTLLTATSAISYNYSTGINGNTYTFRVRAVDMAGNTGMATSDVTVDTTPPAGSFSIASIWNQTPFILVWSGFDSISGLNPAGAYTLEYSYDNMSWEQWLTSVFNTTAEFGSGEGSYYFRLKIVDTAMNTCPYIYSSVLVDMTPPLCTIQQLPATTYNTSFTVSWSGSDSGAGILFYTIQYREAGGQWQDWINNTLNTSSTFAGIRNRQYEFRVTAVDMAGNIAPYSFTTTYIATGSANITSPLYSNTTSFVVSWFAQPPDILHPGVFGGYYVEYSEDQTGNGTWLPWLNGTSETSATFAGSDGHLYSFRVQIRDTNSNIVAISDKTTTLVDTSPPLPPPSNTSTPSAGLWTNSPYITVSWTPSSDSGSSSTQSGVSGYSILWSVNPNGSIDGWTTTTATVASYTAPASCKLYLFVAPVDRAGNIAPPARIGPFLIDLDPPSLAVNTTELNRTTLKVTFRVWDNGTSSSGVNGEGAGITYIIQKDGEDIVSGTLSNSTVLLLENQSFEPGTYILFATPKDSAGNSGVTVEKEMEFPWPQKPRAAATTIPTIVKGEAKITVEGNAESFGWRPIEKIEFRLDNGSWEKANGTSQWSFVIETANLTAGTHNITIRAYDGLNYSDEYRYAFTYEIASVSSGPPFWLWIALAALLLGIILIIVLMIVLRKRTSQTEEKNVQSVDKTAYASADTLQPVPPSTNTAGPISTPVERSAPDYYKDSSYPLQPSASSTTDLRAEKTLEEKQKIRIIGTRQEQSYSSPTSLQQPPPPAAGVQQFSSSRVSPSPSSADKPSTLSFAPPAHQAFPGVSPTVSKPLISQATSTSQVPMPPSSLPPTQAVSSQGSSPAADFSRQDEFKKEKEAEYPSFTPGSPPVITPSSTKVSTSSGIVPAPPPAIAENIKASEEDGRENIFERKISIPSPKIITGTTPPVVKANEPQAGKPPIEGIVMDGDEKSKSPMPPIRLSPIAQKQPPPLSPAPSPIASSPASPAAPPAHSSSPPPVLTPAPTTKSITTSVPPSTVPAALPPPPPISPGIPEAKRAPAPVIVKPYEKPAVIRAVLTTIDGNVISEVSPGRVGDSSGYETGIEVGMLAAVQDLVKKRCVVDGKTVDQIKFGPNTLLIVKGPTVYMAVLVKCPEDFELAGAKNTMRKIILNILDTYKVLLKKWDGTDTKAASGISIMLREGVSDPTFFTEAKEEKPSLGEGTVDTITFSPSELERLKRAPAGASFELHSFEDSSAIAYLTLEGVTRATMTKEGMYRYLAFVNSSGKSIFECEMAELENAATSGPVTVPLKMRLTAKYADYMSGEIDRCNLDAE